MLMNFGSPCGIRIMLFPVWFTPMFLLKLGCTPMEGHAELEQGFLLALCLLLRHLEAPPDIVLVLVLGKVDAAQPRCR